MVHGHNMPSSALQAFFVAYRFLLPLYCGVSLPRVVRIRDSRAKSRILQLGLFLVSDLVSSYYLALAFQCSHVVSEVGRDFINSARNR